MEQRLSVVTLGVTDLVRARAFYESGLGWRVSGRSNAEVVFLQMGGLVLALYPEHLLADDATVTSDRSGTFRGMTLAYNTSTRDEVDAVLQFAATAGARIVKPAQDTFWGGYAGYFADPDGHLWEVVWNPHWSLTDSGELILPD
ncbi:MAG: VOC family protein [Planctomycetaceae bacterium]|nr:VOC family protein [Planctomycetaceae bacterium]